MFCYTVRCHFTQPGAPLEEWLHWLQQEHLQHVLDAGAVGAHIVRLDAELPTVEIRYTFTSRSHFEQYEEQHAPRLRQEGLQRFPLELGLAYERSTGEVIHTHG